MTVKKKTKQQSDTNEFVLKHRITGAGVLLFLGALVVPWLLGAPQSAQSDDGTVTKGVVASNNQQESLEKAIAEELAPESTQNEQVYISKITPLDGLAEAEKKANFPNDAIVDKKQVTPSKAVEQVKDKPIPKKAQETKKQVEKAPAKKEVASNANLKPKTKKITKVEAPIESSSIKVGWAVQVGVFTDKRGSESVINALKKQGFAPQTTTVDTNKGPNTGTRVWLGPFAQRVEAAKAKTRLKNKTGEAGFIRKYP